MEFKNFNGASVYNCHSQDARMRFSWPYFINGKSMDLVEGESVSEVVEVEDLLPSGYKYVMAIALVSLFLIESPLILKRVLAKYQAVRVTEDFNDVL